LQQKARHRHAARTGAIDGQADGEAEKGADDREGREQRRRSRQIEAEIAPDGCQRGRRLADLASGDDAGADDDENHGPRRPYGFDLARALAPAAAGIATTLPDRPTRRRCVGQRVPRAAIRADEGVHERL
jgi:hypothetical protein